MKISVIIVTRNQAELLKKCLVSLTNQTEKPAEVLIIDNNSEDNTRKVIDFFTESLHIKYFLEKKLGISFARNKGIRNSKYDLIAFIDSDCIADENWVKNIGLCFEQNPDIKVIAGKTLCADQSSSITKAGQFLKEYYIASQNLDPKKFFPRLKRLLLPNSFDKTHFIYKPPAENLALKKQVFKTTGLFDEKIVPSGEDSEFCWRLNKKNIKILFQPNIVVRHHYRGTLKAFLAQHFSYGVGISNIKRKWSDFPSRLPSNIFNIFLFLAGFFAMPLFKIMQLRKIKDFALLSPLILLNEFAFRLGIIYGMIKK